MMIMMMLAVAEQAAARTVAGQVVRVIDGDTVEVLVDRRPVRVRLSAIDAPEIRHGRHNPGQPFGQASRRSLSALIAGHRVTVEDEGKDRYGRMLGTIYDGGRDINAEQVRLGMAWVYRHYSHDPMLLRMEQKAREAKRGLWADPHPVPPWEYRHRR